MKNRAETKESILAKSRAVIEQRQRRKKALMQAGSSIAACFAIGFVVFAAVRSNIFVSDKDSGPAVKFETAPTDDSYKLAAGVRDLPRLDKAMTGESDEYLPPDSLRIVSPEDDELTLLHDDSIDTESITKLCDLLAKLDMTEAAKNRKPGGAYYVIEASYDDYKVTVCLSDQTLQINGGDLMEISAEQSKELYNFLGNLNW